MELSLDRLTKQYGRKIAVDCVSATLKPGVYGLLGARFPTGTRAPKGQLRVRFPQGTFKFSGNEDGFIAVFLFYGACGNRKKQTSIRND